MSIPQSCNSSLRSAAMSEEVLDLDADGRKKLTVRQQCLRLISLVIFVVLFPFVVIALGAYRAASVVRGLSRRRRVER